MFTYSWNQPKTRWMHKELVFKSWNNFSHAEWYGSLCCLFYDLNPAKFNPVEASFRDSNFSWFSWHNVITGYTFKLSTDNQVIPDLDFPLTRGASSILGLKWLLSLLGQTKKIWKMWLKYIVFWYYLTKYFRMSFSLEFWWF